MYHKYIDKFYKYAHKKYISKYISRVDFYYCRKVTCKIVIDKSLEKGLRFWSLFNVHTHYYYMFAVDVWWCNTINIT